MKPSEILGLNRFGFYEKIIYICNLNVVILKNYTIEEASKELKLAENTIKAYLFSQNVLKYTKEGKIIKIPESEIMRYKDLQNTKKDRMRSDCLYNNEFKVIDSEIKAYFLGFLYADGCLFALRDKKGSKDFGIRINIHHEDGYILEKIKETFPFFRLTPLKGNELLNRAPQILLEYYGRFIYRDFRDNGLIERKSYENKDKLFLPTLSDDLMRHFIRGFFDGDGSISIAKSRPNLRRVDMVGVSKATITEMYNYFCKIGLKPDVFRTKAPNPLNGKGRQVVYIIEWLKIDSVLALKEYLYKDSTIHLKRKKEKFDSLKRVNKLDKGVICPHCKCSDKIGAGGQRQMKKKVMLRFICFNCNKKFSIESVPSKKLDELLEHPKALSTGNSDNLKDGTMGNQQPS